MGITRVEFKIYGANGKAVELEAIVDTGATFSKVCPKIASQLGLMPEYEIESELGNGKVVKRKVATARAEIEDKVALVPIAIGEDGERNVIGYTTLEILGFKVNPISGKLEKVKAIE